MATSRCPRSECRGSAFETVELRVAGTKARLHAVQCASCGAVVGVTDLPAVAELVERLVKQLSAERA